jgi:hypothetical protein
MLPNVLRVRQNITDFLEWIAALSTTLRAVPFCRTLDGGRASTRGFSAWLSAFALPAVASCKLRPFPIVCAADSSPCRRGSVYYAPEMHHFIETAQKIRCLKRSSSGYGSAGVLTFRCPFALEI